MEIRFYPEGEDYDVVLVDDGESLSWAFSSADKAQAFAADLEELLRAHAQNL